VQQGGQIRVVCALKPDEDAFLAKQAAGEVVAQVKKHLKHGAQGFCEVSREQHSNGECKFAAALRLTIEAKLVALLSAWHGLEPQ